MVKKRKKKKVMIKELSVDQQAVIYASDSHKFSALLHRVISWVEKHRNEIETRDALSRKDFQALLNDLGVPCTFVELTVISNCFEDVINCKVVTQNLKNCLENVQKADLNLCRFIQLKLNLHTPTTIRTHPGVFSISVQSNSLIHRVQEIIKSHYGGTLANVKIYRHKEDNVELDASKMLEDYGYSGGTMFTPTKVTLYYDVFEKQTQCPLLKCDHYFLRSSKHSF